MAKIIDYVVITSSKGFENLETLIKQNINLGWQPLGGVTVINSAPDKDDAIVKPVTYVQAMALYEN